MKKLKSQQFKTISNFCNDIAKGLILAVVLGQITVDIPSTLKILFSVSILMMSFIVFYFAVYFSGKI